MILEFIVFLIWFTSLIVFGAVCIVDKDFQIPRGSFFIVLIVLVLDRLVDLVKLIP